MPFSIRGRIDDNAELELAIAVRDEDQVQSGFAAAGLEPIGAERHAAGDLYRGKARAFAHRRDTDQLHGRGVVQDSAVDGGDPPRQPHLHGAGHTRMKGRWHSQSDAGAERLSAERDARAAAQN